MKWLSASLLLARVRGMEIRFYFSMLITLIIGILFCYACSCLDFTPAIILSFSLRAASQPNMARFLIGFQ